MYSYNSGSQPPSFGDVRQIDVSEPSYGIPMDSDGQPPSVNDVGRREASQSEASFTRYEGPDALEVQQYNLVNSSAARIPEEVKIPVISTPSCEKNDGLRKGQWTVEEDFQLISCISKYGDKNWRKLPKNPWTEDEHKLFLLGLQIVGKGDWRGISRNFVKTRTPTQVASHAQKYFRRQSNLNRRRRRSSLFDITTDSVAVMPTDEQKVHEVYFAG
ncbi:hypothetical protein LXL04_002977 [Taraxacum kok-saghyz]